MGQGGDGPHWSGITGAADNAERRVCYKLTISNRSKMAGNPMSFEIYNPFVQNVTIKNHDPRASEQTLSARHGANICGNDIITIT